MNFLIRGDGNYLGLVDVSYKSFVGRNWAENPKLLEPYFIENMQSYSCLFWDTNLESNWMVEVKMEKTEMTGFRNISGSIKVTAGKLAILEYDALTMMAQFEKHTIEEYMQNVIPLENGNYLVRVVQLFNPKEHFPDGKTTDFVIEIIKQEQLVPPWSVVPWSKI